MLNGLDYPFNFLFSDYINEDFSPTSKYDTRELYEEMHCFGSGYWIKNIEERIKKYIDDLIDEHIIDGPTIIFFNVKPKKSTNLTYIELNCPELVNQSDIVTWIKNVTFKGTIFYGNDKKECQRLMMSYHTTITGAANCYRDLKDDTKYTVNLITTYYDGNTLGFLGTDDDFKTIIYHELMHAYQSTKSKVDIRKVDISNDSVCNMIIRNYRSKSSRNEYIDENEINLYKLTQIVYFLSPRERAAFIGQQNAYFSNIKINSRDEFYNTLNNSDITKHIKMANDVIEFLNDYDLGNMKDDFIKRNIEHIVSLFFDDKNNNRFDNNIRRFIRFLKHTISDMKNDLHNIAYWSLSDETKRNILSDFTEHN